MKTTKLTIAFLLLILVFTVVPSHAKAIDDDFLASLPYGNPINHNKGYEDFVNKSNIIVFGLPYDKDTMSYLLTVDNVIASDQLSDKVNLLFLI